MENFGLLQGMKCKVLRGNQRNAISAQNLFAPAGNEPDTPADVRRCLYFKQNRT